MINWEPIREAYITGGLSYRQLAALYGISYSQLARHAGEENWPALRACQQETPDAVLQLSEYNRFSKGIFQWVGFKTKWIEYENVERVAGETGWSLWQLFTYSIEGIIAFTTVPLSMSIVLGTIFSVFAFIYLVFIIVKYLLYSDPVQGFATIMCAILFLGGIQLLSIGILGKYLEKTYKETKNRPIFIVKETNIDDR